MYFYYKVLLIFENKSNVTRTTAVDIPERYYNNRIIFRVREKWVSIFLALFCPLEREHVMNPILYSALAYGLTIIISYIVIGIIVAINSFISKKELSNTKKVG